MVPWWAIGSGYSSTRRFLDRANINLNERSVFHFLLTFPFYEHEWDIAGFLLNARSMTTTKMMTRRVTWGRMMRS